MLRKFSGVSVKRVIDKSLAQVPEHAHEWPVLSLFVLGSYTNRTEIGERVIDGPSALFYRAGAAHQNVVGRDGFEQIEIEFDPAWLNAETVPCHPVTLWMGGVLSHEARSLARLCTTDFSEERLRLALSAFLRLSGGPSYTSTLTWPHAVAKCLQEDPTLKVKALAKVVHRNPSWLGESYKRVTGEHILETAARMRVQRATRLLRETNRSCSDIAADAGFCDQSHMNRTFRRVLGRLPLAVREDRADFRA